jgi:hypothetical protein
LDATPTSWNMPLFDPRMHGNHVGLVKPALSGRERKRKNALEEENKAVALVWWCRLSQAMAHGGGAKG